MYYIKTHLIWTELTIISSVGDEALTPRCVFMCVINSIVGVSPLLDSILQLSEDSAMQVVDIGQLTENISKSLLIHNRLPIVIDRCQHRLTEILPQKVDTISASNQKCTFKYSWLALILLFEHCALRNKSCRVIIPWNLSLATKW